MKKTLLAFLMTALFAGYAFEAEAVNWSDNYQESLKQAQAESKPIVLFFTGSDWCSFCMKLEKEALDTSEFDQAVGDKVIFVKVDFPRKKPLAAAVADQNNKLKQQYKVTGFPMFVILDSSGNKIDSMGYNAGGGKVFAEQLLKKAGVN